MELRSLMCIDPQTILMISSLTSCLPAVQIPAMKASWARFHHISPGWWLTYPSEKYERQLG